MLKTLKIISLILVIIILIVLVDTFQAKYFNNRPIFKIVENYNSSYLTKRDSGFLVYTYNFSDKSKKTVFKWEKYAPPISIDDILPDNDESYFFGKIVEVSNNYIVVEPDENEAIRKSADKISVSLNENTDEIYKVGTKVKITYTGDVMETYPAQVKLKSIEVIAVNNFTKI